MALTIGSLPRTALFPEGVARSVTLRTMPAVENCLSKILTLTACDSQIAAKGTPLEARW